MRQAFRVLIAVHTSAGVATGMGRRDTKGSNASLVSDLPGRNRPVSNCMHAERGFASQTSAAAPALKVQLRELYKRIHPDRFHAFPPARDTNERSFKLLQEYLAAGQQQLLDTLCLNT